MILPLGVRTRLLYVRRIQPPRTSEEAYAQMNRMQAFERQVRDENLRAAALEHEEQRQAQNALEQDRLSPDA